MTTTDADRIAKVRIAIDQTKIGYDRMQSDMAEHFMNDGWTTGETLDRIIGAQARLWVFTTLEQVLTRCQEDPETYTLRGTVEALRRRLIYMLENQSIVSSTSATHNLLENAKITALQTIILTGPLAGL